VAKKERLVAALWGCGILALVSAIVAIALYYFASNQILLVVQIVILTGIIQVNIQLSWKGVAGRNRRRAYYRFSTPILLLVAGLAGSLQYLSRFGTDFNMYMNIAAAIFVSLAVVRFYRKMEKFRN
jgi:hypothetical protein